MYNNDTSALITGGIMTMFWLFSLALYIVQALAYYKLAQKAHLANAWLSWIPLLQIIILLHLINKSGWNILLLLIPIADIVIMFIWYVKFLNAFGMNGAWVLLAIFIQIGWLILLLVMAFTENIQYQLEDNKYAEA